MPDNFVVQSSALPSSTKLVAFHGTEGVSKPYRFELYLVMTNDVGQSFDMAAAVGQPVSISLERSDGGEPFLRSGVLGSIELINEFAGRSVFRATMVPRLAMLAMSFHSRVFTLQAIPAIIQAVLQKGGVTGCALQLQGSYTAEEHVCQYRESDYAFVARWMEREGIYYYFEHGEGGETLVLVDDKSAHQPHGGKPIRYYPQPGGANTAKDTFHAFTCRHTALSQARCVSRPPSVMSFAASVGARSPQRGSSRSVIAPASGSTTSSLSRDPAGTMGCSETALLTTVSTAGTRPAATDIAKLHDPWQWMTAFTVAAPVSASTVRTAAGWSCTAAWSRSHRLKGSSMLALQSSSHTSHPCCTR